MEIQKVGKDQTKKSKMLSLGVYDGKSNPFSHIENCLKVWKDMQLPSYIWTHRFFYSLGTILKAWYVHGEKRRKIVFWKTLQNPFFHDL
jgi:hypothetical protein